MAKNPNLNWNQLYLDMSNQKTQQAGGGCYVYLKPIAGSTQYTGSVQIFYGINIFQSAGFTVVGDPTGYTTDDDNGVLTFTKSGTYEVSNNYLPDSTTQISKHRIVINNCEVEIKFSGDITMNNGTPISMTGTKPVTHLYSDQDATINCTSTSGPGMAVSGGQTLILDGAGTYATVGASISPGIGANGSWGEIQIIGDCSVTASHPSSTNTYPLASIGGKSGTMGQSKIWINTSGVIKAYGVDDYYTHGCAAIGAGANNNAGAC
jgi:hypothetical protein